MAIDVGVAEAGSGAVPHDGAAGDRSKGVNGYVLNTITPETERSCLYFWAFARNYCLHEQRLTHELREGVAGIFREDELILEAQQRAIDARPEHRFYNLNIDAGGDVGAAADRPPDRRRGAAQARRARDRAARAEPRMTRAASRRSMSARRALARAPDGADDDAGASQTERALLRLRELIVGGELASGERVPELALVERLGVSRTPVRAALQRLQEEGLLEALPGGGFAVRGFDEADIHDAIEVRATIEGAGRAAGGRARRRRHAAARRAASACRRIDALLAERQRSARRRSPSTWRTTGSSTRCWPRCRAATIVRRQIERVITLPFASPNAFVMVQTSGPQARDTLVVAQAQHHAVMQAIDAREGTRAAGGDARARADRARQPARRAAQPPGAAAGAGRPPDPPRRPLNARAGPRCTNPPIGSRHACARCAR